MGIKNQVNLPLIDVFSEVNDFNFSETPNKKKSTTPVIQNNEKQIIDSYLDNSKHAKAVDLGEDYSAEILKTVERKAINVEPEESEETEKAEETEEGENKQPKKTKKKPKPKKEKRDNPYKGIIAIIIFLIILVLCAVTYFKTPERYLELSNKVSTVASKYVNKADAKVKEKQAENEPPMESTDFKNLSIVNNNPIVQNQKSEYLNCPKDIKPGEYLLVLTDSEKTGFFEISTSDKWDAPPTALTSIGEINNFRYIEIHEGEFLKLKNVTIYNPADIKISADNGTYYTGMYKAGTDCKPGYYEIVAEDDTKNMTVEIFKSNGKLAKTFSKKNIVDTEVKKDEYISVKNGIMTKQLKD